MDIRSSILLTDLYQLTMLQGYMEQGMEETAVFEFFVRKMPKQRGFFMAAGLEQLVEFLETVHFTPWELDWIEKSGLFSKSFVAYLERLTFSGDLHAMPEGTVFFTNEPIARVTAPLPQAQRDPADQYTAISNVDCFESCTVGLGCCGKATCRFWFAARAWSRGWFAGGSCELPRRLCRVGDRFGRTPVWCPPFWHNGSFLYSGTYGRNGGV